MKTKKISLHEFKSLIKKIIKEEYDSLNEDSSMKDIKTDINPKGDYSYEINNKFNPLNKKPKIDRTIGSGENVGTFDKKDKYTSYYSELSPEEKEEYDKEFYKKYKKFEPGEFNKLMNDIKTKK
jgi:hypothetical protein